MGERGMIKLIPILPTKVLANWHKLAGDVRSVLKYSNGDMTEETTLNNLLSGDMVLMAAFKDDKHIGHVILSFKKCLSGENVLTVVQAYVKKECPFDAFTEICKEVVNLAKKHGCNKVKCYSLRKGMARRLEPIGFKPSYVEYVKEV